MPRGSCKSPLFPESFGPQSQIKMASSPTDEVIGPYELQQMSGALPSDEIATLTEDNSSAVIDKSTSLHDESSREAHESSGNSLEILERTYHTATETPKTSLEVLKCAHQVSKTSADRNVSSRDNNTPLEELSPAFFIEEPSEVPLPPTPSNNVSSTHPSLISLPPSSFASRNSAPDGNSLNESCNLYRRNNLRLAKHFPHLRYVCSDSRNDKASITIFDYNGSILRDRKHLTIDFRIQKKSKLDECYQSICSFKSVPQIETRLIVVEDLGPSLINLLGATFDLSPELFEEHLHRSGYCGSGSHGPSPSTWRTSNLQKNYVSFAWFRPGERWKLAIEPGQWEDLLKYGTVQSETTPQSMNKRGQSSNVSLRFVATTNIFRSSIEMSTDPGGQLPDRVHCGWEERATLCKVELNDLQYVLLLLDPIPLLEKIITGATDAMQPSILRGEHEEYELTNCITRSEIRKFSTASFSAEDRGRQTELLSSFTQLHSRTPWNLDYRFLFKIPIKSTVTQNVFDPLSPFESTAEAFEKWLVSAGANEVEKYSRQLGPGSMIFRIAHQDTVGLLQLMRSEISKIDLASSDTVLQETALYWRGRLDEFRACLLELEASLHSFADFLHANDPASSNGPPPKLDADPIGYLLHDAIGEIEVHKQRIAQVYSSLTSKTQISDSHRSIAEAETVTRLTELAFLFIPLSFATSIFGMQIVNGSTPATTYIAVAVALTSAAYVLRFIIHRTTEQRSDLRQLIRNRVTIYAELRTGSRISTATFLRWLIHIVKQYSLRFWKWSFLGATVAVMLVIPLPIIWTSSLDTGLRIALSCLLISIPMFFVGFYFWAKYSKRQRLRKARIRSDL